MTQPPEQPQYQQSNPPQPYLPVYVQQMPYVTNAIPALVFSLVGLIPCLFGVPSIVAVVLGHSALREIGRKPYLRGHGQAVAALIIGYPGALIAAAMGISFAVQAATGKL